MYTHYRKLVLASGIALALSAASGVLIAGSASQDVVDARHETQIWTTYTLNPYLRADDLKVSVQSGRATLTGNVGEEVSKELAKEIALGVEGVKDVDNQILVRADHVSPKPTADRGYAEVIDDATINATVKSKLMWSKHTDGMSTNVDTKSGRVMLQGTADSAAAKDLAGRLAMNTHGVVAVDNQLRVQGVSPTIAATATGSADEAGQDIADSWITTKVKSTLLYSSNVAGSGIAVSTRSGVVTLSGKLATGAERALAIELAENVRGVKSVHSTGLTI